MLNFWIIDKTKDKIKVEETNKQLPLKSNDQNFVRVILNRELVDKCHCKDINYLCINIYI